MPWPRPNKGVQALLSLAVLAIYTVGRCDPPAEPGGPADLYADNTPGLPSGELPATAATRANAWAQSLEAGAAGSSPAEADDGARVSINFGHAETAPLLAIADQSDVSAPVPGETEGSDDQDQPGSVQGQLLLLDMTVNGTRQGAALMMMDEHGNLYALADTLARWGMREPLPATVQFSGRDFHAFGALPGVHTTITTQTMSGSAQIPPRYMTETRRSLSWGSAMTPTADVGAFLDYGLSYVDDPGLSTRQISGLARPTVFTELGNLSAELLYRNSETVEKSPTDGFLRLDTTWTRDFPDRVSSLRIGDAITKPNSWSRSLRFGGIQLATNFATQPTLITFPQPSISGSAAVPTALDIFVNGSLRDSQEVPDGTFRIDDIPVVTGAGQIQVVTRDLMGREQLVVQDFYAAPNLLRPGLSDYSISVGALRKNYGVESNSYSEAMFSSMLRRGISSNFTLEGRLEGTGDAQVAGAGAAYSMTRLGEFSSAVAVSRQDDIGVLWQLGHEYQGPGYRFNLRFQGASENFVQPGVELGNAYPRLQSLASVGSSVGSYGSVGLSIVDERFYDETLDRKLLTLNYSRALPADFYLSLSGSYILQQESDLQASLVLMKQFGGRRSASSSMQGSRYSRSLRVEYRDDVPTGPGFGYRAAASTGDSKAMEAETTWNTNSNRLQAEIRSRDGNTGWRGQVDGSLAWLAGDLYANREIRDGFAVVDLGGFEGVRVYLENREMGVTDGEGRLMIPGLLPYQANRISINSRDLPLTARVSSTGEAVAPYYRSGLIVEFDVKETHSALLRVMMPDGTPAPEGAQAQVVGSPQLYPMGRNGRLYLQDLVGDSRVLVTTQTWQCMLQLPKPSPAQGEAISNLGEFTCVAETI